MNWRARVFVHFHTMPMRTAGGQNEAGDLYAVRVVISN